MSADPEFIPSEELFASYGELEHTVRKFDYREYGRVVLFDNPNSRRAKRADAIYGQLLASRSFHGMEVVRQQTSREFNETLDTLGALSEVDDDSTLYVIYSGEGAQHDEMEAAIKLGIRSPFSLLCGGNANDIARQLQTGPGRTRPVAQMIESYVATLRPLMLSFEYGDDWMTRPAFGYASVGVSAKLGAIYESDAFRGAGFNKLPGGLDVSEKFVMLGGIACAKPFELSTDTYDGPAVELLISNGNLMGKRLHPAADLLVPGGRVIHAANRRGLIASLPDLLRGAERGTPLVDGDTFQAQISSNTMLAVQVDGKPYAIPGPATVTAEVSQASVAVLTNRLPLAS